MKKKLVDFLIENVETANHFEDAERLADAILKLIRKELPGEIEPDHKDDGIDCGCSSMEEETLCEINCKGFNLYRNQTLKILGE